jgi:hypothetical protein
MRANESSSTARGAAALRAAHLAALGFEASDAVELLDEESRSLFERVRKGSAELGEPRRATHDSAEFRARVVALGYETSEDLAYEDPVARCFAGRSDGLLPYPQQHLALFRTV